MTREEAIELIAILREHVLPEAKTESEKLAASACVESLDMAISALQGSTREQVEKVFPGCDFCNLADFGEFGFEITKHYAKICCALGGWRFPQNEQFLFCPKCGKPLTDEGVEMAMKRFEEMQND